MMTDFTFRWSKSRKYWMLSILFFLCFFSLTGLFSFVPKRLTVAVRVKAPDQFQPPTDESTANIVLAVFALAFVVVFMSALAICIAINPHDGEVEDNGRKVYVSLNEEEKGELHVLTSKYST